MKYKFLTPVKNRDDKILDRPEFRVTDEPREEKPEDRSKVNYMKKPVSERGQMSFIMSLIALVLFLASWFLTLGAQGNPSQTETAIAASSLIFSAASLLYGFLSFLQKDRNHLFSFIGISLGGIILITWSITILVGAIA